jgi:two-component system phosphate regulon sensor histidine kinase PhoR
VTGGILLNDGFTARLRAETGVEQSVLVDGERVASSIEGAAGTARTLEAQTGEVVIGESRYYTACVPLAGGRCSAVAQVEAALPIAGMIAAQQRALSVLALSTALVALLGSAIGALLARRLTAPLAQLTRAASAISQGDLETPVPIPTEPLEIRTLAAALEESRASTRRSLEGLAQARDWSENLIRSINEGVVTFDTAGNITFFSEGAERIMGWPSAGALGRPVDEVFKTAGEDDEPFTARIPPRGGKHQISVLTRDGRPVTLAVSGARLVPPQGETVQVALVLRDVTEEEAGRHLRSYFLANITHEFRTPLAALSASIELLMDEAARLAQPGISELLGSLHLSVLNLQTLIDNLLESSSIEAGRFTVRRRPTDLNRVVASAIRTVQPLLDGRAQPLSLAEPTRLPTVQADPTRLVQVLVNLLSNASKYSPPGAPVDLSVEVSENRVRVAVADRGPGIPPGERASLFRRFVRLDTPGQEQYGIGLGLSVARAIVEGHGGEIGVDERAGGGSVFWFTLPLEDTP